MHPLLGLAVALLPLRGALALRTRHSLARVGDYDIAYPEAPSGWNSSAVQAVYVACGERYCSLGIEALRSLLAQAKLDAGPKPTVHLFVDEDCAARIEQLKLKEPNLSSAAHLLPYVVSRLGLSSNLNLYKQCAGLRLSLPELLPDLQKVLYMDTDTYVVGSLAPLWRLQPFLWAMAENDYTWYNDGRCPARWHEFLPEARKEEMRKCFLGTSGVNSGVMLMNLTTWRRLRISEEVDYWVQSLTKNGSDPTVLKMGDQDVLNIISAVHERDNYTLQLPCEMNSIYLNRFMCFYGPGNWMDFMRFYGAEFFKTFLETGHPMPLAQRNARQPVVIHAKFNIKRNGEHCWVNLHMRLRQAVDSVSKGIVPHGARSVCDVMGGCDLS